MEAKRRSRPPWGILIVGGMFLFCAGFLNYLNFLGPRTPVNVINSMVCLLLALVLIIVRSQDIVARWGALLLAKLSVLTAIGPFLMPPVSDEFIFGFRYLPPPLGIIVLLILSFSVTIPATATTFLGHFPRKPFKSRRMALMIWTPAVVTIPIDLKWFWLPIFADTYAASIPVWMIALGVATGFGYLVAALILLLRNYFKGTDPNERRRLRVLVTGFTITISALALSVLGNIPWKPLQQVLALSPPYFLISLYAAAPICIAYAILRHRMFDIRVMVRLGLRYAAARGLILSVVPLIGVAFVLDLLTHVNQTLNEILSRRGWIYAVLGLGALLLHSRRKTWLESLDRRFFRERYDAQQILRGVVEDIRLADSFEEAIPVVISQIENALHPDFAALLLRGPDSAEYRVISSETAAFSSIPAESKLISLTKLLGKPIEISQDETGWLQRQLPPEEVDLLKQLRLEWLFPISLDENGAEALLALGVKKSEEPYSREDQDLIEAIVGSLSLLLKKRPTRTAFTEVGFKECPECGACYEADSENCADDGQPLKLAPFSRMLMQRYRLDRQLGQGGMGTVYQAFDTELDRHVAIKMIRQGLLASEEAAVRFKREAKAAAGFTHPNVVTIHDFGVSEDRRAYIIMELLEGVTLREELQRQGGGGLQPDKALNIMNDICAAVSAAHERHLLHRDLKPENIVLARTQIGETAKILDFGIAKSMVPQKDTLTAQSATEPGVLIGTFRYMSPEQLRGGPPAESWDLWAIAVVAYEMLSGVYPFGASPDWQNAVLTSRIIPVQSHVPKAPEAWQKFFEKALAVDPLERSSSAKQLFSDFKAALS